MASIAQIVPCLWFDGRAEQAVDFYCGIFANSRVTTVSRYTEVGQAQHRQQPGTVMMIAFELNGQTFHALNGGPLFQFTPALSLEVLCEDQAEIDHFWERLGDGGNTDAQQCGWLQDRYGLSWQIVPRALIAMLGDAASPPAQRVLGAVMTMKKLDLAALERAYAS